MFESRVKEGTNLLKHRQQRPALLLVGAGRIFKIKAPVQSKVQDKSPHRGVSLVRRQDGFMFHTF